MRGFTGNVVLTEALFFEDFDRTWRAVLPSVTNPLRGGLKKVRLLSTPNGVGSKGAQIWAKYYQPQSSPVAAFGRTRPTSHPEEEPNQNRSTPQPKTGPQFSLSAACGGEGRGEVAQSLVSSPSPNPQSAIANPQSIRSIVWSCHRVDIHDAIREGLQLDAEELRAALDDPEGWAQEYELNFLDQATVLLPYEVIAPCENPLATETPPDGFWGAITYGDPVVLGIDFAANATSPSAGPFNMWTTVETMTREVLALDNMSTPEQIQLLRQRINRADRVCFDYTGAGMGMGDFLAREFGEHNPTRHRDGKIELCTFTNPLKVEIFSKLRMEFERRKLGMPRQPGDPGRHPQRPARRHRHRRHLPRALHRRWPCRLRHRPCPGCSRRRDALRTVRLLHRLPPGGPPRTPHRPARNGS